MDYEYTTEKLMGLIMENAEDEAEAISSYSSLLDLLENGTNVSNISTETITDLIDFIHEAISEEIKHNKDLFKIFIRLSGIDPED